MISIYITGCVIALTVMIWMIIKHKPGSGREWIAAIALSLACIMLSWGGCLFAYLLEKDYLDNSRH